MLNYIKKNNINIGLLGGTFDPAHKGHITISKIAKNKFKLKYVLWCITKKNPFKQKPQTKLKNRINFIKKIVSKEKFIKIEFLEDKINSRKTIDTIKFLKNKNSSLNIFFMMGADNLIKFHKWDQWQDIVKIAKILVFDRQRYKTKSLKSIAAKKMPLNKWNFIKFNKVNISSSQIRKI